MAVQCTQAAATCFCASMGTGPQVPEARVDLTLTEIVDAADHWFLAEAGTGPGREVLAELNHQPSTEEERLAAVAAVDVAARPANQEDGHHRNPRAPLRQFRAPALGQGRRTLPDLRQLHDGVSYLLLHDRGRRERCYGRPRRTVAAMGLVLHLDFSYIHGGSVRTSSKARYRQWMTHKLASWIDQFGTSGCVGCGRCITWCPVGIDITEELRAIRGSAIMETQTLERIIAEHPFFADLESDYIDPAGELRRERALQNGRVYLPRRRRSQPVST